MSTGGAAGAAGAGVGGDGAGLAGNGNGDGGDASANGQQQQGQAFDPGQIAEMLQGLQGSQEQLRQQFTSFIGQQGQDDGGEYDGGEYDAGDLPPEVADVLGENDGWQWGGELSAEEAAELGLDGDGDGEQDDGQFYDPATMASQVAEGIQGLIQQATAPAIQAAEQARQEVADARREADLHRLADEFPELLEEGVFGEVSGHAVQLGQTLGWPAEVATSPHMLRLVYLAGRAIDTANAEDDAPASSAFLEGGAGSSPSGGRVDAGDAIVNPQIAGGAQGSHVLPFQ